MTQDMEQAASETNEGIENEDKSSVDSYEESSTEDETADYEKEDQEEPISKTKHCLNLACGVLIILAFYFCLYLVISHNAKSSSESGKELQN